MSNFHIRESAYARYDNTSLSNFDETIVGAYLYSSGVPSNSDGIDGDSNLDTVSGKIYLKVSGVWVLKFTPAAPGSGTVTGTGTDKHLMRWSGATAAQDTGILCDNSDNLTGVTSLNKVTVTQPATSATLTIANGATLTVSASATLLNGTHSGTNTGDQTSIVGITGTLAQFNTACTDADFARVDAGNIFVGHQTIEGVTSTGATGTGKFVFDTSPTLITPLLGTPTSGVLTNCTGTASGLTAGNVITNANLTGPITSVGNTTSVAAQTGTGSTFAMSVSPTFTGIPAAPTASAGTNTTQIATTAFVSAAVTTAVTGLLNFKGSTDCSSNPNYPAAVKGDSYIVSVAGKIGGASGTAVDVGDWYVAEADNAGGTEASVGTSWGHLEHNLVGALLASNNLSDVANVATARSNLGLVIGTNVQAYDAFLLSIAALGTAADKMIYTTGVDTAAETPLTAAARTVLDDTTVGAMLDTLGGATHTGTGGVVCATSPTLVTPALGAATATSLTTTSGNVSIGTTNPGTKVSIANAQYLGFQLADDTGTAFFIRANSSNGGEILTSGYATPIKIDASSILLNTISGHNVGIGTASPATKLDVAGTITATTAVTAGHAVIETWPVNSNFALFGHASLDLTNSANYAVMQNVGGDLYLNSPGIIHFQQSNTADYGQLSAAGNWLFGFNNTTDDTVNAVQVKGTLGVQAGGSSAKARAGGCIFDHSSNAGNTTTTETDLYSDTLAASTLGSNGDKVEAEYAGTFVSSATATRQVRVYFAGTAILDTGALTLSLSSTWCVYITLIRVSSTVVRYMASLTTEGAALAAYTATGELTGLTLSATNILKITGQAAGVGAATGDITAKMGSVFWRSSA